MAQQLNQTDDRHDTTVTDAGDPAGIVAGPSQAELPPKPSRAVAREEKRADHRGNFFTILKKGQGYWTRMGTAVAAGLIICLAATFIYNEMPSWIRPWFLPAQLNSLEPAERTAAMDYAVTMSSRITLAVAAAVLVGLSLLAWRLMNKPSNVDFLIATDSEMKKVNWTSRKELIGSTKVVILFMFLIAIILFGIDILFGYLFYFMNVLKTPPL